MRVSGVAHGDGGSAGSGMQLPSPVAPLLGTDRAERTITCATPCSCAAEKVCASNGGALTAGSFRNCARVTARGGALPASGVGRNGAYEVLFGAFSCALLMKYDTGLIVPSWNCVARA